MTNDPMTDDQRTTLEALSRQTGETIDGHLTKDQAAVLIDDLREKTGVSAADQDAGVGPIDGQEAMDDDSDFRHTPVTPNANR